jgi:Cu(I)/Ag(I) efflux system membrane fusion protein
VLVVGKGQYKSVEVSLGQVTNQFAQILDGVEVGEQVVISAQFLLDSESSIQSDFMRMSSAPEDDIQYEKADEIQDNDAPDSIDSADVEGVINQINLQTRVANISRGPIEKWGRGAATLDFVFADSVSLNELQQGDKIHFTFEIRDGDFLITDFALTLQEQKQEHNHD